MRSKSVSVCTINVCGYLCVCVGMGKRGGHVHVPCADGAGRDNISSRGVWGGSVGVWVWRAVRPYSHIRDLFCAIVPPVEVYDSSTYNINR